MVTCFEVLVVINRDNFGLGDLHSNSSTTKESVRSAIRAVITACEVLCRRLGVSGIAFPWLAVCPGASCREANRDRLPETA
jgi:hypothetical protein